LAQLHLQTRRISSLRKIIEELNKIKILSRSTSDSLLELIYFGNKAAHGEEVSFKIVDWAIYYAPKLLWILDQYMDKIK
jgi:hypothetical protein